MLLNKDNPSTDILLLIALCYITTAAPGITLIQAVVDLTAYSNIVNNDLSFLKHVLCSNLLSSIYLAYIVYFNFISIPTADLYI